MTEEQKRLLDPNYGNGSMLMRPEDSSIQGASEDFMKYLQNPTSSMMSKNSSEPIESYDAMLEQEMLDRQMTDRNNFDNLKGNGTPPLASIVASAPKVPQNKAPMSSPSVGNSTPVSNTSTAAPKQIDILEQLKAARMTNREDLNKAKGIDNSVELANALNKSFNQIGTGVANQAGYTKIASNPLEVSSDELKLAAGMNKEKLDALMQEYGIKKSIEDSEFAKKQAAQARADRLSDKAEDRSYKDKMLALEYAKLNKDKSEGASKNMEVKELMKEDIQIKKENRKTRSSLDTAEKALEEQIRNLESTSKDFEKYSKGSIAGTGPLATGFGIKKSLDSDLETLNSRFKKGSLDEMVKMFSGMSKAVDSEGERKAFESTQPSIELDDPTNRSIIAERLAAAKRLLEKTKKAKQNYDRTGDFKTTEEQQDALMNPKLQVSAPYGETVERNGKTYKWNSSVGKYQPIQ